MPLGKAIAYKGFFFKMQLIIFTTSYNHFLLFPEFLIFKLTLILCVARFLGLFFLFSGELCDRGQYITNITFFTWGGGAGIRRA